MSVFILFADSAKTGLVTQVSALYNGANPCAAPWPHSLPNHVRNLSVSLDFSCGPSCKYTFANLAHVHTYSKEVS